MRIRLLITSIFLAFWVNTEGIIPKEPEIQGYAETSNGKIWYHSVGNTENPVILTLHGGPGGTCYSLYPLTALADSYRIILFDQPGGGRSYTITDTAMMTMDYFVEELQQFVEVLELDNFILYGHSWGTMLAIDYYLSFPEKVDALILNSPLMSTELWESDADTLLLSLPDSLQKAVAKSELTMNFNTAGYRQAMNAYYKSYIRLNSRISTKYDVERRPGNRKIYNYMWGPSEFTATGTLKSYERLDILQNIDVPSLWITGEFDEARPTTVEYYSTLTSGSSFAVIEDAAHATMHDNPKENIRLIRKFLEPLICTN